MAGLGHQFGETDELAAPDLGEDRRSRAEHLDFLGSRSCADGLVLGTHRPIAIAGAMLIGNG